MKKHSITRCNLCLNVYTVFNMSLQTSTTTGIPPGFGERLREERKRLKMNQTQLAEAGGIQRLAQLQYEAEATAPTTRYLSSIGSAGVDLAYLILGVRFGEDELTPAQAARVEEMAFEWVQKSADTQPEGKLSAETFRLLFTLFRGYLTKVELGQQPSDIELPALLISGQVAELGRR